MTRGVTNSLWQKSNVQMWEGCHVQKYCWQPQLPIYVAVLASLSNTSDGDEGALQLSTQLLYSAWHWSQVICPEHWLYIQSRRAAEQESSQPSREAALQLVASEANVTAAASVIPTVTANALNHRLGVISLLQSHSYPPVGGHSAMGPAASWATPWRSWSGSRNMRIPEGNSRCGRTRSSRLRSVLRRGIADHRSVNSVAIHHGGVRHARASHRHGGEDAPHRSESSAQGCLPWWANVPGVSLSVNGERQGRGRRTTRVAIHGHSQVRPRRQPYTPWPPEGEDDG